MTAPHRSPSVFGQIIPLRYWMRSRSLHRWGTVIFAIFVGYPIASVWLIANELNSDQTVIHALKWVDYPFVLYFAFAWLVAIFLIARPRVTPLPLVTVAVVGFIVSYPISVWLETTTGAHTNNLFASIIEVGGSEEFGKLVPVVVTVFLVQAIPGRSHEVVDRPPKTFLYLGVVSGVVVGCIEAVQYISGNQFAELNGKENAFSLTVTVFERLITDPINHALWAGIAGFFVGLAVSRSRRDGRVSAGRLFDNSWLIVIGLAIAATLHGINDFTADHPLIQVAFLVVSALLLLGYAIAGDVVEAASQQMSPRQMTAGLVQWGHRMAATAAAQRAAQSVPPAQAGFVPPAFSPDPVTAAPAPTSAAPATAWTGPVAPAPASAPRPVAAWAPPMTYPAASASVTAPAWAPPRREPAAR